MFLIAILALYIAFIHHLMNRSLKKQVNCPSNIMIILGAKIKNGEISPVLKSRLDKGFELWQQNPDLKVIVSGGFATDAPMFEAALMHDYLLDKGMDPQCVFIEDKSRTTYENLMNCWGMSSHSCICTIVSSEFHTVRVAFLAKRLDFPAQVIGAKTPKGRRLRNEVREHLAIIKSWMYDKDPKKP